MKRLILLLFLFAFTLVAHAQFPGGGGSSVTGRISGSVIDSLTRKPIDYATITLYRSGGKVPLNGVVTDEKGVFKIDNLNPGKYKVSISFIGYPTKTIDPVTTTPGRPDFNIGAIRLSPTGRLLKGVDIVSNKALIENHIDKLVYNAEKDLTSSGGNATDVLRKVPLLSVDLDGNVSLRGDQNVRVLINGKPSGALSTSLADVLKTIPADQIKSVEVITSPSAKYDAEGSGGIINIITKTNKASGFSGAINGGIGTRQNNGNINLNYKHNRLSLGANIGGNAAWPQTSLADLNSVTGSISRTQTSQSKTTRQGLRGSVNGSYDFNQYNSITSTFAPTGFNMTIDGNSLNTNSLFSGSNGYTSSNYNKTSLSGFDWNADYTHKFKKKDEEITISGQWSHTSATNNYATGYFDVPAAFIRYTPNQTGANDGTNDEYTAQADYTLPINSKIKFEAGGKSIFRRINSDFNVFRQTNNEGPYLLNDTASNQYSYNQNVYAGYTVFTFTLPKSYSLQAGARVENTQISGLPTNRTQPSLSPFSNSYTTFVPSIALAKSLKGGNTVKLTYTKRIQRPSLTQINPFVNKANADNQTQGSPTLSPEVSQTLEFGYTAFIKSSVVILSTYYKHTNDLIEGIAASIFDSDLGRTVTRTNYLNIGKNNSFGLSAAGSINPIKPLTIRGSANFYTYAANANANLAAQQSSNNTYIQYNIFTGSTLELKKGFAAEVFAIFNSPRRNIQGTGPAFNLYGFGLKKDIIAKKFTLGLNALSPFQKYLNLKTNIQGNGISQNQSISYPIRSFGVTFSYSFGKITYGQQTKKKGINNDDLMPGDNGGGGGVPTGGAGGGGGGRPQ
ncbi:TonB-dependent receptor domain-containing protein [Mucilaginibacter sp.]|uniref:TonB-dependent receptor domain-containing protein n=1 Tax=Mucilaginibacter sp. TaxID=1882438 RepID=UPI003B003B0F